MPDMMSLAMPGLVSVDATAHVGTLSVGRPSGMRHSGMRLSTDPDEALLERIVRGDRNAVALLVSRKLPKLLSLARRMLGDAAEAEDVAQETLVRTWKQAHSWVPGKARIDTWMHRVALNLCYDRLRRRRDTVNSDDIEIVDTAAGPGVQIEQAQSAQRLQTALAGLPERQRVAITLCYYQEMSNIEAAELMEVSVEALESLLARARRALRVSMSEDFNGAATAQTQPVRIKTGGTK